MAYQDESRMAGGIDRLDDALARIAAAAGRRQDDLRIAELTARAAQHETDLLIQAEQERRNRAAEHMVAVESEAEAVRLEALRGLASRLDGLIGMLRETIAVSGE